MFELTQDFGKVDTRVGFAGFGGLLAGRGRSCRATWSG